MPKPKRIDASNGCEGIIIKGKLNFIWSESDSVLVIDANGEVRQATDAEVEWIDGMEEADFGSQRAATQIEERMIAALALKSSKPKKFVLVAMPAGGASPRRDPGG